MRMIMAMTAAMTIAKRVHPHTPTTHLCVGGTERELRPRNRALARERRFIRDFPSDEGFLPPAHMRRRSA